MKSKWKQKCEKGRRWRRVFEGRYNPLCRTTQRSQGVNNVFSCHQVRGKWEKITLNQIMRVHKTRHQNTTCHPRETRCDLWCDPVAASKRRIFREKPTHEIIIHFLTLSLLLRDWINSESNSTISETELGAMFWTRFKRPQNHGWPIKNPSKYDPRAQLRDY